MLTELAGTRISVGGRADFAGANHVVWACRTKHLEVRGVGWTRKALDRDDPHYLWKVDPSRLAMSINWVDGPARLFDWTAGVWPVVFDLVDSWAGHPVTIVCDQGLSRSPTLAMAYLAKRTGVLPDSFVGAVRGFHRLYPAWKPNAAGIVGWVRDHWDTLENPDTPLTDTLDPCNPTV